ncbi:MAG: septum formation initiator family protein [Lentimicrobiaceae bacterium]|nr:septum formation initiator family protein [Lentimicrobiaceae bacterium]
MNFKEFIKKFNNKYIIATLIFAVIILFTDKYNIFNQIKSFRKLRQVQEQVDYYDKEIKKEEDFLNEFHKDSLLMEKIAREKYMMKRDNEVIYIIEAKE